MKKIVFHLNCLERGGAERVVTTLSGQFAAHGYEVYIATEWQGEDEYETDPRVKRVHVGFTQKQERHNRIRKYADRIVNLRRFLKETKPDIVIAFARKANYRALTAAIGMKLPVLISVRINPIGYYDFLSDKIQIPLLFRRAAGCVFQTPDQRDFFPPYVRKNSRIILNPINDKFIGNPIPEKREKVVVHSGRLVDFKNQLLLIRAFEKVHQKHPDYILKIYGPDSFDGTKEKLEALIAELHADTYVKLMGGSAALEKDMRNAAVAAYSSDYEGMPNALLEAMALGLPVVATDCPPGGPRMVIAHEKNGLLVPVRDEDALAAAINRLIEDRDFAEALGKNASQIGQKASSEVIFEEWRSYVEEIWNSSSGMQK
ncbi:MAG: glycosyltransferase [Lachnospiraceae bacterium]|nr:glycosyltransferase [Lachnospiraceae bacterium]